MQRVQQLRSIGWLLGDCQAHLDICINTAQQLGMDDLADALEKALAAVDSADSLCHKHFSQAKEEGGDAPDNA